MKFYRLNLDTNVEYEAIRASVDSQIGYSGSLTCISPYATAPQDQKGRVLLSLTDNQPGYDALLSSFLSLVLVKKAKELTQDEYDASFFPAPSGGGGGVSSWNDLSDKPSTFPPSAHAHGNITSNGAIGIAAGLILATGPDGVIVASTVGTGLVYEDDALHSDLPYIKTQLATVATTGAYADLSGKPSTFAPSSHTHGNITNAGAIGSTSGQIVVTTASGVLTTAATISASAISGLAAVATSGSGSDITTGTVAAARLGTHASTHQTGGADAVSSVVVTPTSLAADTNDWAIGTGDVFRVAGTAARNITGIAAGSSGLAILLVNVGSFALTLKHASTSSTAANRFTVPWAADCVLSASGGAVVLVYDSTSSTWRVV